MKNSIKFAFIGALIALASITSRGQGILTATNGGIAFRVWNGSTGNFVIASSTTNITTTMEDGLATLQPLTTQSLSVLMGQLGLQTNKAGQIRMTFDSSLSLPLDVTSNKLLAATVTNAPGTWANVYWDSSKTKWQGVGLPRSFIMDRWTGNIIPDPLRPANVWLQLQRIIGQSGGTGTVSVTTYINGASVWNKTCDSPLWLAGAGGTNVSTDVINLNDSLGLPIGSQQPMLTRIARSTTSVDGIISVVVRSADQVQGLSP